VPCESQLEQGPRARAGRRHVTVGDMKRRQTKRARSPGTPFRDGADPWRHLHVPAGADRWSKTLRPVSQHSVEVVS